MLTLSLFRVKKKKITVATVSNSNRKIIKRGKIGASLGKNALLAKMDVLSAFRLLIIHPDDFELFGFKFKDNFFFDKLPLTFAA